MRQIDTNTVIAYFNGNRNVERKWMFHFPRFAVSTIALAELHYGTAKSKRFSANQARLETLKKDVEIVAFDPAAADAYGELRLSTERAGKKVPEMDLLIAAVALSRNDILVTHNTRDFKHINGLIMEDWLA